MGFCDHSLLFESPDNRGFYNWSETEVGGRDQQECFYGSVEEVGYAKRECQQRFTWDMTGEEYNGNDCVTFASFRLRVLDMVSLVVGLQVFMCCCYLSEKYHGRTSRRSSFRNCRHTTGS